MVKVVLRVASTTVNFQIGRSLLQVKPFSKAGKSRGSLVTGKLQEHKELSTVDTLGRWNTVLGGQNGRCGKKRKRRSNSSIAV